MIDLFYMGNLVFMAILTLLLLIIVAMGAYQAVRISRNEIEHFTTFRYNLTYIKSVGLFTLVCGIFFQLLGLYQIFSFIEEATGVVYPAILGGGLKVTMITTIYGVIIFLISYLIWLGLDYQVKAASLSERLDG